MFRRLITVVTALAACSASLLGTALAMPPIGRHHIDEEGLALVTQWVQQMQSCEP